jgi:hypothetical protein
MDSVPNYFRVDSSFPNAVVDIRTKEDPFAVHQVLDPSSRIVPTTRIASGGLHSTCAADGNPRAAEEVDQHYRDWGTDNVPAAVAFPYFPYCYDFRLANVNIPAVADRVDTAVVAAAADGASVALVLVAARHLTDCSCAHCWNDPPEKAPATKNHPVSHLVLPPCIRGPSCDLAPRWVFEYLYCSFLPYWYLPQTGSTW